MRKFTKAATLTLTAIGLTIGGAAFAAENTANMPAKEGAAQALSDTYDSKYDYCQGKPFFSKCKKTHRQSHIAYICKH